MTLPKVTIQSARLRLTLTYLGIIMALSLSFSSVFYRQSVDEARGNLAGQHAGLRDYIYFASPERVQVIQDAQLKDFRSKLLLRLAVLNLGMLTVGAAVSYMLARRSLLPLEEALISQGRFTSDAAHELRTPLTAMKTETEVALRDKNLSSAGAREVLESNLEEIAKLETLTSALLRLAQSSEKVDDSYWQDYALADILQKARDRLANKASERGIKLTLPVTNKVIVHGDPDQLVELFVTLLGNAIKYSHDKGRVDVKITKSSSDKVRVDVSDRGVGITEVDLPHIFERFYRADASRTREGTEGYGLGLSLAQAIVTAHGGEIKVKSTYGKGSTFSVLLPLR